MLFKSTLQRFTAGALILIFLAAAAPAQAETAYAMIACDYHAEGGPTVSVADINYTVDDDEDNLTPEGLIHTSCSDAMASLSAAGFEFQRSNAMASCQDDAGNKINCPLLIIAEDVEGEAAGNDNSPATVDDPLCLVWIIDGAEISLTAACDVFAENGPEIVSVQASPLNPNEPLPDILQNAVGMGCAEFAREIVVVGSKVKEASVLPDPRVPWKNLLKKNGRKVLPFAPIPDHLVMEYLLNSG